jgi:disulfide bond formation protein DsbB
MINKKNTRRAFGVFLATFYASIITIALRVWLGLHIAIASMIFIGCWIGFYLTGIWVLNERPAELDKTIPISSKERRKIRQHFTIG